MKKLFLTLAVAVLSLSASAQVYVGGEFNVWRNWNENTTNFTIRPEVGYNLSDKWAIGLRFGYDYLYSNPGHYDGDHARNYVEIAPYARFTPWTIGPVGIFFDGGFGFATAKAKGADESYNSWEVGIRPGVSVTLTKKLSFISHIGFFGYRDSDDGVQAFGEDGFGLKLKGNDLTFGLQYNF